MSAGNTIFTGSSRYASDFRQVIDRAVAIASLPLTQLNNQKKALGDESTALGALNQMFSGLQAAVSSVSGAAANSFQATVGDPDVASASAGAGAYAGTYSLRVTSMGSYSTAMSASAGIADPGTAGISNADVLTLTVGGGSYTLKPASHSLTALANAINAAGAGVTAAVVNVGPPSAPNYRLSLQASKLGAVGIQLNDGTDLLSPTTGTPAKYQVNGAPEVSSDSRHIALAPGLTVDLEGEGSTDITVARDSAAVGNAISNFVNGYNAAASALDKHRGQNPGVLAGHAIVLTLSQALRGIAAYQGSGGIASIAGLGLSFDKNGVLSFDSAAFAAAFQANGTGVLGFLGNGIDTGFLGAAARALNGIEDPTNGSLWAETQAVNAESARQDALIARNQDRVDQLQESLQKQMAAADALIASLEQQVTYLTNLFDSIRNSGQGGQ